MSFIKDIIENPHAIYLRYKVYWDFLLQSYEGGLDYTGAAIYNDKVQSSVDSLSKYYVNGKEQTTQIVTGNLFKHAKERNEDYSRRLQMSYYYNFCAPIIDIYNNHLFKEPVIEDFAEIKSTIESIDEDIDRTGSSVNEFRQEIADVIQIYGHAFVIVDSPSIPETNVLTKQDQIDNRAFPYLTIHSPQNVINWSLDEYGSPYWVLVKECYDSNSDPKTFDKEKKITILYRLWTRNTWELYDVDYNLIAEGVHPVGEVPIVCIFDKKSRKARNFLGISSIADISFIARDIYNACSELRQILRDQTFSFLAINGTSDEYSELSVGTGKGLLYPEGRNVPQYISPSTDNTEVYFSHIDRQVSKIFQLAKLEGGGLSGQVSNPSKGGVADQSSGVSKAWDFNQTNSALSEKAGNLEDGEMKIWRLMSLWQGSEFTGNVQYPNEFSITSLKNDLDELEQEMKLQMGITFNVEVRKAIIKKKFPRKPEEEIEKMVAEIEKEVKTSNEAEKLTNRFSSMFNKNVPFGNGQTR